MARTNLKIEQSVPELYPRLVQYVNGNFYDGNGNLLKIGLVTNANQNRLIISDGTTGGLTTLPEVYFENNTLIINANLQLVNGSQQNGYYLISDSNGLSTWKSFEYRTTQVASSTYSLTFDYDYYGVVYNSGICQLYLPEGSSSNNGKIIIVSDEVGSISIYNRGIQVFGYGTQSINGYSDILMKINNMSLTFIFRNGNWKTI